MAFQKTSREIRVFLDSSVIIAAAISAVGAGRELVLQGIQGTLKLSLSTFVLLETETNLQNKQRAALPIFEIFKTALLPDLTDPSPTAVHAATQRITPKDAPIVAAALAAGADYLATYDRKHLLREKAAIQSAYGLNVVTPDEILTLIRQRPGERRAAGD
ncbi:MAG: PIN domain-containing protein [Chloroflexi bacterium]|nr:PIN domain-containing protein [Chloroflexota bacterium]